MKKIFRKYIFGRKILQPIFEFLHYFSIIGMNLGRGGNIYDSGEIYLMKSLNLKDKVVFDVGANVGDWTQEALNTGAIVYSFEPNKEAFNKVVKINPKNSYNYGIGDKEEEVNLYAEDAGAGNASIFKRYEYSKPIETIKLKTLNQVCNELNITPYFLKLDVEGYEINILKNADVSKIKYIQFELGGIVQARTYLQDFFKLLPDFEIHRILQDGTRKINYTEFDDVMPCSNYLAINKNI